MITSYMSTTLSKSSHPVSLSLGFPQIDQISMEVPPVESGAHLTSAAAFVEGGIQEACDDACSICLEAFSDNDPSTLTGCKHEFHLQCILEWCQRSSQCPMCWQAISLKDPTSQELFEGVERERTVKSNPPRSTAIFHHPTLGDFELQHLPVGVNDAELEERIIQHLAAAAAMGRARHIARREGQRNRSSGQGRPQYLVFSTHPPGAGSSSPDQMREGEQATSVASFSPSAVNGGEETSRVTTSRPSHSSLVSASASGSNVPPPNQHGSSMSSRSPSQSSPSGHDRAGPSDLQSFSETMKARFNAVSMKYKESISKSTRGWKERLFSRNSSVSDVGPEVRREVDEGIATVSRTMEHLEATENNRINGSSGSDSIGSSVPESENRQISDNVGQSSVSEQNKPATCAAGSSSN